MFSAASTISALSVSVIDQPTILRLKASSTMARERKPDQVGMEVMPATQSTSTHQGRRTPGGMVVA